MNKASLPEKFSLIQEYWRPKVVAEMNGQELKLVKFSGVFPWHHHEHEHELFLVWRGQIVVEFRDRRVVLEQGELCVVPRGVEHRTMADSEAEVLVFEPRQHVTPGTSLTKFSLLRTEFPYEGSAQPAARANDEERDYVAVPVRPH